MLRQLEDREINKILSHNFGIWSPGLNRALYLHYQWWQMQLPWGRANLRYFGHFASEEDAGSSRSNAAEPLASCKLYRLQFLAHSKVYRGAGIGAVFVPEQNRGRCLGHKLLNEMIEYCRQEGFDFIFLNSDIGAEYYEKLGFQSFDPNTFSVVFDAEWQNYAIKELERIADESLEESVKVRPVSLRDIELIVRHHGRWLANQSYGLMRSEDYMEFKLGKELYLKEHSSLGWPQMDIISVNEGKSPAGYALIEQAGAFLRVLEVIAPEKVRLLLWRQILILARRRNVRLIRGWSKNAPPLKGLKFASRDWSLPMILPLKAESAELITAWTKVQVPSMLELDHF